MASIRAIYENGVFRPTEPVPLAEGTAVTIPLPELNPDPPDPDHDPTALERALAWLEGLKRRTPEEVEAANRRLAARSQLLWPIPEGKSPEGTTSAAEPADEVLEKHA